MELKLEFVEIQEDLIIKKIITKITCSYKFKLTKNPKEFIHNLAVVCRERMEERLCKMCKDPILGAKL